MSLGGMQKEDWVSCNKLGKFENETQRTHLSSKEVAQFVLFGKGWIGRPVEEWMHQEESQEAAKTNR